MKPVFLLVLLTIAGLVAGCANGDPAPTTHSPLLIYTDAAGVSTKSTAYQASLSVAPASAAGRERRVLAVRATLPDGSTLELLYYFVGTGFPRALGAVPLDEAVQAANYPAGASTGPYHGGRAVGTLTVEAVSPAVVSGTFDGPVAAGGPSVRLAFQHLTL